MRLVVGRILPGSSSYLLPELGLARLRHLEVVAVAFSDLLQLPEYLRRHIGLLPGERHRLRVVLAEVRLDILQPLGYGEITGLEPDDDRAARLIGCNRGIVESIRGAAVDDRLVLLVAGTGARGIGLRDDELGVEVGQLLAADQLAIAVCRQPVLGPEFLDLHSGLLRALAKLGQPALQPDSRALGGVEAGIKLIRQIGIGIGLGDGRGESRIGGLVAHGNDVAAADAIGHQLGLQLQDRIVVTRGGDHRLARRGVDVLDSRNVIRAGAAAKIGNRAAQETDTLGKGRLRRIHELIVLVELQLVDHHRRQPRGIEYLYLAEDGCVRLLRNTDGRDVIHDLVQAFVDQHARSRCVLLGRGLQVDQAQEQADDGADRHHLGLPGRHAKQTLDVDEVFTLFRFGTGQWHPLVERKVGIIHLRSNSRLQALPAFEEWRRYQKRPRNIRATGRLTRKVKRLRGCRAIAISHMHPKFGHYAATSRRSCDRTNCFSISKTGPFMSSRARAKAMVASMKPSLEPQSNMRPLKGWA